MKGKSPIDFRGSFSAVLSDESPTLILPHNLVCISDSDMQEHGLSDNDVVFVQFRKSALIECVISGRKNLPKGYISVKKAVKDRLKACNKDTILIHKPSVLPIKHIKTQDASAVCSNKIGLSSDDLKQINTRFSLYKLYCPNTGCTLTIPTSAFIAADVPSGTIKMNLFHRTLLDIKAPAILSNSMTKLLSNSSAVSEADCKYLYDIYGDHKSVVNPSFEQSKSIRTILEKIGYYDVQIIPVLDSYQKRVPKQNILRRLIGIAVGSSNIQLKCGRPYVSDEKANIIRLSHSNMTLLGVDEGDWVIVRNGLKSKRALALCAESFEEVSDNNIMQRPSDIESYVGIPVSMRASLNITDINQSVSVERDPLYIFNKNLNIQFLPILALLFTIIQTFSDDIKKILIIFTCSLPLALYIIFSPERSKCKRK